MEGVRRKDGMPFFRLARFIAAMLMLGTSCGGESPRGATPTTVTPVPTEETTLAPVPGEEDEGRQVAFQDEDGAKRIFLIGGSMGGIAVFRAAETALEGVEGIVSISTPQFPSQYYPDEPPENDVTEARLQAIPMPKLFIAGDGDV